VEANEVFVALPAAMDAQLRSAGAVYHPWTTAAIAAEIPGDAVLVRLVTSFATTAEQVDRFIAVAAQGRV
jgi:threonine aldolase